MAVDTNVMRCTMCTVHRVFARVFASVQRLLICEWNRLSVAYLAALYHLNIVLYRNQIMHNSKAHTETHNTYIRIEQPTNQQDQLFGYCIIISNRVEKICSLKM